MQLFPLLFLIKGSMPLLIKTEIISGLFALHAKINKVFILSSTQLKFSKVFTFKYSFNN